MLYSVQRFFVSQMLEISVTTKLPAQLNNFRLLLQLPYLGSYLLTHSLINLQQNIRNCIRIT